MCHYGFEMKVIAIAGLSCSGKTTLAHAVASLTRAQVLSLDDYYLPLTEYTLAVRHKMNFDAPEMYDFDQLGRDLDALQAGHEVDVPLYDFVEFTRSNETMRVRPDQYLIIEGQYALYRPEIAQRCSLKIFLDESADECLSRRIHRDAMQRGRTREEVQWRFMRHVLPMYERFVSPSRRHADLILEQMDVESSVSQVCHALGMPVFMAR